MKQNDWIVARLINPELSTNDLYISGLNTENTQLLTLDLYKQSPLVLRAFTEEGRFNEEKMEDFYKESVGEFGRLQSLNTSDSFIYDPFDTRAKKGDLKSSPNFKVFLAINPTKLISLLSGATYDSNLSTREIALLSKVWDSEKQTWLDYSPNDKSLFSDPAGWIKLVFTEPLIYATYNEDGVHKDPFSNRLIAHKKGLYKLNDQGLPYTETLGNQSLIGKEVVSGFDTITIDDEGIDKYNFFDSDGLDKSLLGTINKTAAAIAPLLMGPYIAPVYSGIMVTKEIMKTLPMLYGIVNSWTGGPTENATLNKLSGIGKALTASTSDEGKKSILNTETLATLLSDVALQWGLLKFIANSISKLRGSDKLLLDALRKAYFTYAAQRSILEKLLEKNIITHKAFKEYAGNVDEWFNSALGKAALNKYTNLAKDLMQKSNRLGADASLIYMALISNTDVYDLMLQHGASRKEASWVTLGSTLGMFSVDRFLHLGEMFFDDVTAQYLRSIRNTFSKEAASWRDKVVNTSGAIAPTSKKLIKNLFNMGYDFGAKTTNKFIKDLKYHSLGFGGKAVGEGLEEVTEELVTDISKGIYELAGDLGYDTQTKDVGAWDNMAARYGMSFLGGTLGGGLFYGIDIYQNGKFNIDETLDELIYIARNNRVKEALKILKDYRDKGELGNVNLSMRTLKDSNNKEVFLTAEDEKDSLNEFIYNRIRETLILLDNIINGNNAKLSEEDLYENMILSNVRFKKLLDYLDLKKFSYTTGYQQDYQQALNNLVNAQGAYTKADLTITGMVYDTEEEFQLNKATDLKLRNLTKKEEEERNKNLKFLKEQVAKAKELVENFTSGKYSYRYTRKMLYALDEDLNKNFVTMTYHTWLAKNHYGKKPEELTPAEALKYKEEYLKYKRNSLKDDLELSFLNFENTTLVLQKALANILANLDNFKIVLEKLRELYGENSVLNNFHVYEFDDVLDFANETKDSESYLLRGNEAENTQRVLLINEYNLLELNKLKDGIIQVIDLSGGFIDPLTRRDFKLKFRNRTKDIISLARELIQLEIIEGNKIQLEDGTILQLELSNNDLAFLNIINRVDVDNFSNVLELFRAIDSMLEKTYVEPLQEENKTLENIFQFLEDSKFLEWIDSSEYDRLSITGSELKEKIELFLEDGFTVEQIFDLNNLEIFEESFVNYKIPEAKILGILATIKNMYELGTLDTFELKLHNITEFKTLDLEFNSELNHYKSILSNYIENIKSHPLIQLNKELDLRISKINPVTLLLREFSLSLNYKSGDIEALLNTLDRRFNEIDDLSNLILQSPEKDALDEAEFMINLVESAIRGASLKPSMLYPFGHNAAMNEFAKANPKIYPDYLELPVLNLDVASMYLLELSKYKWQIGMKDPKTGQYNSDSWRGLSSLNEINKAQQNINADKALNTSCYDLFINCRLSFIFSYNNKKYDLLEGIDSLPLVSSDSKDLYVIVNKVFNIFHSNILKLIDDGWSYKLIWERSKLLDNICKPKDATNFSLLLLLKVSNLDEYMSYDTLTNYDKFMIMATAGGLNSTEFVTYMSSRVAEEKGIVPLTILEWVSREGIAYIKNPEIFISALEYAKEQSHDNRPIIKAIFCNGNGGAGKSRVVAKNIANSLEERKIWLSTPKESQIYTLQESIGYGEVMLNTETLTVNGNNVESLINTIVTNINKYKEGILAVKNASLYGDDPEKLTPEEKAIISTDAINVQPSEESPLFYPNFDLLGIKKIDNSPKALIIDEATHLNAFELSIISEFCNINNIELILLGDSKLSGLKYNIQREHCITVRTLNLGISLRDNNVQHQYNLHILELLILKLTNSDAFSPNYAETILSIKDSLKVLNLKVYSNDDINGDLITSNLTDDLIAKIPNEADITVGYVGSTESDSYRKLASRKFTVTPLNESEIQGQEFTYVIVNKSFKIPNNNSSDLRLRIYLLDLYTMISRARKGTIILDPTGKLRESIGNNIVEEAKASAPNITDYLEEFTILKLLLYKKFLLGNVEENSLNTSTTSSNLAQNSTEQEAKKLINILPAEEPTQEPTEKNIVLDDLGTFNPDTITSDNNFNTESLDFDNNYYFIYLLKFEQLDDLVKKGIDLDNLFKNNFLLANTSIVEETLHKLKEGNGYEGADTLLLLKFNKASFDTPIRNSLNIIEALRSKNNELKYISNNNISNVIHVTVLLDEEDIITTPSLTVLIEQIPKEEFKDPTPIYSEDIPGSPALAYGAATLTGFANKLNADTNLEEWINVKLLSLSTIPLGLGNSENNTPISLMLSPNIKEGIEQIEIPVLNTAANNQLGAFMIPSSWQTESLSNLFKDLNITAKEIEKVSIRMKLNGSNFVKLTVVVPETTLDTYTKIINSKKYPDINILQEEDSKLVRVTLQANLNDSALSENLNNLNMFTLRDGAIFSGNNTIINNTLSLIDISNMLRGLKNSFLFHKKYEDIPEYLRNIKEPHSFSKDAFNNVLWHLEIREIAETDNFIRNIHYKKQGIGISSKKLVYAIVGTIKDNSGYTLEFTLGLLSNPDTWIKNVPNIITKKTKSINALKEELRKNTKLTEEEQKRINDEIIKLELYIKDIDLEDSNSRPNQYNRYVEDLALLVTPENPIVKIPIGKVITPGLINFHKLKNVVRLSRISLALITNTENEISRLQSLLRSNKVKGNVIIKSKISEKIKKLNEKLKEFKEIKDYSFRSLNPYVTVSPMYIYTPSNEIKSVINVDDSLIGRYNTVFVTTDEGYDPNAMVNDYILLKVRTDNWVKEYGNIDFLNTDLDFRVRLMPLINIGVSFQDLSNPYLLDSLLSEVTYYDKKTQANVTRKNIFPFKTNFMGVRMYVGLWNFRANLLQFRDYFNTFALNIEKDLGITLDEFDDYLRTKELLWRKENKTKSLTRYDEDFLLQHQSLKNFKEFSELVDLFNLDLGNVVKEFRLGSDLEHGAYVRLLKGDLKLLYNIKEGETVNGIYINYNTLNKYINIAEVIFNSILNKVVSCDYDSKKLLSANEGVKNSYANHIKTLANKNGYVEFNEYEKNPVVINFTSSYDADNAHGILNSFSHIPAILVKAFKYTNMRMNHINDDTFDYVDKYSIHLTGHTIDPETNKEKEVDEVIPYTDLWGVLNVLNAQDEFDADAIKAYEYDNTLSDFFSFAFHGTLLDVLSNAIKASDAYFPHGLNSDPLATTEIVFHGPNKVFIKSILLQIFFGTNLSVEDPTFYVDLNTLQKGVDDYHKQQQEIEQLKLLQEKILEKLKRLLQLLQLKKEEVIGKLSSYKVYTALVEPIDSLIQDIKELTDLESVEKYANKELKNLITKEITYNFNACFDGTHGAVLNGNILIKLDGNNLLTLELVVNEEFKKLRNEDFGHINKLSVDNGKLIILSDLDKMIDVTKGLNGTINIEYKKFPSEEVQLEKNIGLSKLRLDLIKTIEDIEKSLKRVKFNNKLEYFNNIYMYAKSTSTDIESDIENIRKILSNQVANGILIEANNPIMYTKLIDSLKKINVPNC